MFTGGAEVVGGDQFTALCRIELISVWYGMPSRKALALSLEMKMVTRAEP